MTPRTTKATWSTARLSLALLLFRGAIPSAQSPWIEARSAHYSVFYQAGFDDDVRRVRAWADETERVMKDKYGVVPLHYRMSIYLHPTPTTGADVNTAHNHCCRSVGNGDSIGMIDMLASSAAAMKDTTAHSSLGMPKSSDDYHAKILISEYIPIGHFEAQNARPSGGWKYYTAPNWFVQGLQEYDAIFHSTATNRDTTAKRLSAWAAANAPVFSCCAPDLAITNAYNGGAAFMTFLAVQFGEGVHARLLRSGAPTFADALTEQTKPYNRSQLFGLFQQWLGRGAPAPARDDAFRADALRQAEYRRSVIKRRVTCGPWPSLIGILGTDGLRAIRQPSIYLFAA
jgi:hypothetical protein